MNIDDLPLEILESILDLVLQADYDFIQVNMLVCKKWHNISAEYLYRNIRLDEKKIQQLKLALSKNTPAESVCLKYGHLVKAVYIPYDEATSPRLNPQDLDALLSCFVNLTAFSCYQDSSLGGYMKTLLDTTYPLKYLSSILVESEGIHAINGLNRIYYLTCYKFRSNLTKMAIYYDENNNYKHNETNIIDQLKEFPRLIDLLFSYTCHPNKLILAEGIEQEDTEQEGFSQQEDGKIQRVIESGNNHQEYMTLFEILMASPKLSRLEFQTNCWIHNRISEKHLQQFFSTQRSTSAIILHHEYLQSLTISTPSLIKPYMEYLSSYAPLSLEEIIIRNDNVEARRWVEQLGIKSVLLLCERLSHARISELSFSGESDNSRDLSVAIQESKRSLFYRLAAAIKNKRPLYCDVVFSAYSKQTSIIVNGDKSSLSAIYGFEFEEFTHIIPIEYEWRLHECDPLPFFDNLQAFPFFHIHDICFHFSGNNSAMHFPHLFVKTVVLNCPRLQNFELYLRFPYGDEANIRFGKLLDNSLPTVNTKKYIENITAQDTTYFSVAQYKLDTTKEIWPTVASYLPNIKKIICKSNFSFLAHEQGIPPEEPPLRYTLDLSAFAELQVFIIDADHFFSDSSIHCFIIKFVSNSEKETETHLIRRVKVKKETEDSYYEEEWECTLLNAEEENNFSVQECCYVTVDLIDKEAFNQFCLLHSYFCYIFRPYRGGVTNVSDETKCGVYSMTLEDHQADRFNNV